MIYETPTLETNLGFYHSQICFMHTEYEETIIIINNIRIHMPHHLLIMELV